jgi:mannan endo-1,4-beta-mannosidase
MRVALRSAIAPALLMVAIAFLILLRQGVILHPSVAAPAAWPVPRVATPALEVGATTGPLARNSWEPWKPEDLRSVNAFEQAGHRHAEVVMFYADWEHTSFSSRQLEAIAARGAIPEITWEPWDASRPLGEPQPRYRLAHIIEGRFDNYIRSWAHGLARFETPVRLRFAQEMNGFWFPWSELANGNHRGEFVKAWRHVHDLFTAAGADNVEWVWAPVRGELARYLPGPRYVDRLGMTCLNGGPGLWSDRWRSLPQICGPLIANLHALAPDLPIEISELGSGERGGNKAEWIREAFAYLKRHREIETVVWLNLHKEADWRINSSLGAEHAGRAAFAQQPEAPR